jgi:PAS domain S-box-containing protein
MNQNRTYKSRLLSGSSAQKPEHHNSNAVADLDTDQISRILMENMKDAMVIVDLKGSGLFANKAAEKLSALNFYGGKLNTADSFKEIFTLVLDSIDRILGFGYAEIDLKDGSTLRVMSQHGYKGSIYDLHLDSEIIGIVGKAAKLRKPILVPDVRVDKDYLAGYPGALSELVVPIISEGEVLGVLNVESTELNAFDEKDIVLLEILASHAATALSNLRRKEGIKEALRYARESEQKCRDLFENARDLILTTDIEGNITSANRVLSETGYDRSEVIGQNVFNFVSGKGIQDLRDSFQRLFDRKSAKGELRIKSKIGTEATVEYNGNAIIQNGKIVGFQVIMRDVTHRKQMEEELKQYSTNMEEIVKKRTEELLESERKYSTLVEELSDGVAIIQDEDIIFINKRGLNLLQYSKDEVIGTPFEKFANETYRRLVKERCKPRIKQGNVSPTYEANLVTKKGEELVTEICAKTIRYKGRPAVLCAFRDIRERKQAEEQRLRLEKMATIGEVATMVAHDLRNPLTAIRNASFYIRKNCPHQTDAGCVDVLEMLNIIEQETIFADNIVNDLLGFTARELTQKQKQDINKLLESSLKRFNIPDDIEIEKNFSEDASVTVDSKQIERLFVNLLRNAVQAMAEGGRLTITTKKEEDHLTVAIADTGVGVPKENTSKLFQPLFTTKSKGIGLGLAISKRIATQHAGTIDVASEVGKGTTFTLKLPIASEAASK